MLIFLLEHLNRHILISTLDTKQYRTYDKEMIFLFIWKRTGELLLSFIEDINKKCPSVKFDFKYSKTDLEFLDTKLNKDTNGKLRLAIYPKATDQ